MNFRITISLVIAISFLTSSAEPAYSQKTKILFSVDSAYTYKVYPLPGKSVHTFDVLAPGLIVLPYLGGVYLPGLNSWYKKPDSLFSVNEILFSVIDSSCLLNCSDDSICMFIKTRFDSTSATKILGTMPMGAYKVFPLNNDSLILFLIGKKESHVIVLAGNKKDVVFSFKGISIKSVSQIDANSYTIVSDSSVWLYHPPDKILSVLKLDIAVDDAVITKNNSLYVSSSEGVFLFKSRNEFKSILKGIHGMLILRGKFLYVMSPEAGMILELKIPK